MQNEIDWMGGRDRVRSRRITADPTRWPGLEQLEDRTLLTTTVFLDFGIGVGAGNSISTTPEVFRDLLGNNTAPNLGTDGDGLPNPFNDGDTIDFAPLDYDYNDNGVTDNNDLVELAADVITHVNRVLEPFDIAVSVPAMTDFTDPLTSVMANDGDADGEFDAYIVLMELTSGSLTVDSGLYGRAVGDASAMAGNTLEGAGLVFINNVFDLMGDGTGTGVNNSSFAPGTDGFNADLAQAIAYTAIHEVFHTFSFPHTPDEFDTAPQASDSQRLLASGDVIRLGSRTRLEPFMVTRYDLDRENQTLPEYNNYNVLANDGDIGLRDADASGLPDVAYSTGTGAHDILTYTDAGGGIINVAVDPYRNGARTTAIGSGETYSIDLSTDTDGTVLIDAGINSDLVTVDGSINTPFRIRGGDGIDEAISNATELDTLVVNSAGLTGMFAPDADNINGTVTYDNGMTVDFSEFERVDAGDVPFNDLNLSLSNNAVLEGITVTLTIDWVNVDTADEHDILIDWGNGDTTMVTADPGVQEIEVDYEYPDDHPSTGTASDNFTIMVTLTDEDGNSADDTVGITINNANPAIPTIGWEDATIFEGDTAVLNGVFVDLGFGASTETFTGTALWSDGVMTPVVINGNDFTTSRTFIDDDPTGTPSDSFSVDITINDDDTGTVTKSSPNLTVFNVDPVITAFASDATFDDKGMEGEPVNILGAFTDIGVADTHTAEVDWGDGSALETVTVVQGAGFGSITGSHIYNAGGVYQVTVTLTDDDTGTDTSQTIAVITGVGLLNGTLYIVGSNANDHVSVSQTGTGLTRVYADFVPEVFRDFATADVDLVLAYLCDGDDHMTLAGSVEATAIVRGDGGHDTLHTGGALAALLGGEGDDRLTGQGQRNLLIGGTGRDALRGGNDQDILIGGSTAQDDDNDALLLALNTWNDTSDDYATRAAAIGAIFNVFDDNETDSLVGAAGLDLFYSGLNDRLQAVMKNETVL